MQSLKSMFSSKTTLIMLSLVLSPSAHAGLFDDKEARKAISELQTSYMATQSIVQAQQTALSQQSDEIARLNGKIERLSNELDKIKTELSTGYDSLNKRLIALEPIPPEQLMQQAYEAALAATQNSDFAQARKQWREFHQNHASSNTFEDASYWYGVSAYGTRNNKLAIGQLKKFIQQYPQHERIPDALLTLGSAQIESGQKKAGMATLTQLIQKYPNNPATQTAQKVVDKNQ